VVAGYSSTPLARKLGVKEGSVVAMVHAPGDFTLDVESSVTVRRTLRGAPDVILAFFVTRDSLEREIAELGRAIFPSSALWTAWPKRASNVTTDLTDEVVRDVALPLGLVDNKVCAVDATWSALRLVWRVSERPTAP